MSTHIRNALPVATRIGEFCVEAVVGAGGFGIVYRARDEVLGHVVAIKEYLPGDFAVRMGDSTVRARSGKDEDTFAWGRERFLDEARMLARFAHPNIVRVLRYLEGNGTAYMVMSYVEGERLRELLTRRGQLTEREMRTLLDPLLDGLTLVHSAGAVHRDIKPENIYVQRDGVPVLLDFGAARQAVKERSGSLTRVLTPPYAPLEQYGTRAAQGPWTDLYALGAVVYEALSGQKIPEATDRLESDSLTPLSEVARVSAPMSRAVTAALAVKAAQRPQSIAQWRLMLGTDSARRGAEGALSAAVSGEGGRRPKWKVARILGTIVFPLGIVLAILAVTEVRIAHQATRDQARVALAKQEIQQLETALEMFLLDNGKFPTASQGLNALVKDPMDPTIRNWSPGGYLKRLSKDPWGNDFQYVYPGTHDRDFDVYSLGPGGKGGAAEIGNWNIRD